MIKVLDIDKLPEPSGEGEAGKFWNVMQSDELKTAVICQILSELEIPVEQLTDQECRSVLARCQGLYWNSILIKRVNATKQQAQDIPENYNTEYENE